MELLDQKVCVEDNEINASSSTETLSVNVKSAVEAILFATDEPISARKLSEILGDSNTGKEDISVIIEQLKIEYEVAEKGFRIEEIANGYQILSRPEYHEWISKLLKKKREVKISHASLETLSIIAYKQPVLRIDIESIRGVQSGQMVRTLIDMGLVKITGRADVIGRPLLYGTTKKFLEHFGLNSIKDLPLVED
ncbi:MAG: SMC-Scp complex subunit ScpB [Candidatus Anammoxibacter sp.]